MYVPFEKQYNWFTCDKFTVTWIHYYEFTVFLIHWLPPPSSLSSVLTDFLHVHRYAYESPNECNGNMLWNRTLLLRLHRLREDAMIVAGMFSRRFSKRLRPSADFCLPCSECLKSAVTSSVADAHSAFLCQTVERSARSGGQSIVVGTFPHTRDTLTARVSLILRRLNSTLRRRR